MSGSIERKLAAGFLSATILALILGYGSYYQIRSFLDSDRWVDHTHAVLDEIKTISTTVTRAETSQRGFCITGDPYFLQPFQADAKQLPELVDQLGTLVSDNPTQEARVQALRVAVAAKLDAANEYIALRQRLGAASLAPQYYNKKGRNAMEVVNKQVDDLMAEENHLMTERWQRRNTSFQTALYVAVGMTAVLALLLALVHLLIFRELRARRRIETELAAARDDALGSSRTKSEFLANMSHEIRTPMNGIIGMSGLLIDSKLTVEQREFAVTVQTCADSLLTIINDILDFSKIEAGKLTFELLDFDIRQTVESTIEILAERAQSKGLELVNLVQANVPADLCGDAGRLRQVLLNLLSNAIKFTEHGEVGLYVRAENVSATEVVLLFEVVDTGIGLKEEALANIFEPFAQADGSTTRKYGGTGLGLAISRALVERMDGQIGVKSQVNSGSNFWFTARFQKQVNPPARSRRTPPPDLRVLVVDDNETCRAAISAMLTAWGIKHENASAGREAVSKMRAASARGESFQVALLDMQMPDTSGFALTEEIKNDSVLSATQLVIMHTVGRRGSSASWAEAGISGYVTKPVKQSILFDAIMDASVPPSSPRLGLNAPRPQTFKTTTELSRLMMKPVAAQRFSSFRVLVAEDNMVNQKVALRQLLNLGFRADAVANGREVIDALTRIPYRLVFMDCQMPEMDGYEATRAIRGRPGSAAKVTIVAMTANALEGDRETCLAAGMDDYMSKPVKQEELERVLRRWVPADVFRHRPSKAADARPTPFTGASAPGYRPVERLYISPKATLLFFMSSQSEVNTGTLKTYVNDMLALQKHILEALERQHADERVKSDDSVLGLVGKIKSTLTRHVGELEGEVARLGSDTMGAVKAAVTSTLGAAAGLYDKVRKDPVSRMLRDDYTALNMASFSYTMLHTTGLAYQDKSVAVVALQHLQDLTPLIIALNEIAPHVVVVELQDEGPGIDTSVATTAAANTQHAWKP